MAGDQATGPATGSGDADETALPDARIPLIDPEDIPAELKDELGPAYDWSVRQWGTVPRFFRMLGHAPGAVESWLQADQKLRIDYLEQDPDYVRLEELVIVKTALLTKCSY